MKDQDTFIDQFFDKELNKKELQEFQQRLDTDADFKEEVQFRISLQKAVGQQDASERLQKNAMKKRFKALESASAQTATAPKESKTKVRSLGRWIAAAAAIGMLLFAATWMFNNEGTSTQNLTADFFENNYAPYEADITLKSSSTNPLITELDKAYKSGDYNISISLADMILKESPNDAEILLIKGSSLLERGDLPQALSTFNSISNALYADQSHWYAAMVLIKQNKLNEAKIRLQKIKSKKYLEKLENLNLK